MLLAAGRGMARGTYAQREGKFARRFLAGLARAQARGIATANLTGGK
jgi:hypothetical protein